MNARGALRRGGLVAAACVGCCAPLLILAFGLAGGLALTVGAFLGIAAAVAVAVLGVGAVVTWSRRRRTCPPTDGGWVPLGAVGRAPVAGRNRP